MYPRMESEPIFRALDAFVHFRVDDHPKLKLTLAQHHNTENALSGTQGGLSVRAIDREHVDG